MSYAVHRPTESLAAHQDHKKSVRPFVPPSPSVVIEKVQLADKTIFAVRDDLLPGGTKQRGIMGALVELKEQGYEEFVYASPFCGYAQLALSHCCRMLGWHATRKASSLYTISRIMGRPD